MRARVEHALLRLRDRLTDRPEHEGTEAHVQYLDVQITRFLLRPRQPAAAMTVPPSPPPGSPIGALQSDCRWGSLLESDYR